MNLHVNLAHRRRTRGEFSAAGFLRTVGLVSVVGATIALYILGFVRLTRPLHLEFQAGYWLGFGGLFVTIGLLGLTPVVRARGAFVPIAAYVLVVGIVTLGFGAYRQRRIAAARDECRQLLESAADVHQRLTILDHQVHGLPSLSKKVETSLSCRDLLE